MSDREVTQSEMRGILGFPPEDFQDFEALEKMGSYLDLFEYHDGLFRVPDAASLLGIHSSTMRNLIREGSCDPIVVFGVKWVPGAWIRHRLENHPGTGRPSRRDSPAQGESRPQAHTCRS